MKSAVEVIVQAMMIRYKKERKYGKVKGFKLRLVGFPVTTTWHASRDGLAFTKNTCKNGLQRDTIAYCVRTKQQTYVHVV